MRRYLVPDDPKGLIVALIACWAFHLHGWQIVAVTMLVLAVRDDS